MALFFRARPPLTLRERVTVEMRFRDWASRLGAQSVLAITNLFPTADDFPSPYQGSEADVSDLLDRIAEHVGESAEKYQLLHHWDPYQSEGDGQLPVNSILVPHELMHDPARVVATIVLQIMEWQALAAAPAGRQRQVDEIDVEVLAVLHGLGVLLGHVPVARQVGNGQKGDTTLPSHLLGYSLALLSWIRDDRSLGSGGSAGARNERNLEKHLGLDVVTTYRAGLKYLKKTEDCLFDATSVFDDQSRVSLGSLVIQLRSPLPGQRLAALWSLPDIPRNRPLKDALPCVVKMLSDPSPLLRGEAALAMSLFPDSAAEEMAPLLSLLRDPEVDVRLSALSSIAKLQPSLDTMLEQETPLVVELELLLSQGPREITNATVAVLARYGDQAQHVVPEILRYLLTQLIACDYSQTDYLFDVLYAMSVNVEQLLRDDLAERDPELLEQALVILDHYRAELSEEYPRES